jgi:copper(I)-binding protein
MQGSHRPLLGLLVAIGLLVAACGGDGGITVDDAWGRPSPMEATNAAFYMNITGGDGDDTLISASSESCAVTELHETTMTDGVMSMQERPDGIAIPSGETVVLEPGGLHVMCLDAATFEVGESVDIDLVFAEAGTVAVSAEIRETGDAGDGMGDG